MAFTDAQLKYLKENYEGLNDNSGCVLVKPDMEDLLARLEASERCMVPSTDYCAVCHCEDCESSRRTWRKSKGQQ